MLLAAESSVADWIAAIGQAFGAAATFLAVVFAMWIAHRDRRWRDEERRDSEAAQARLISIKSERFEHEV